MLHLYSMKMKNSKIATNSLRLKANLNSPTCALHLPINRPLSHWWIWTVILTPLKKGPITCSNISMKKLTTISKKMTKTVRYLLKTASIPIFSASFNLKQIREHRWSTTWKLNRPAKKWMKFCWKSLDMSRIKVTSG